MNDFFSRNSNTYSASAPGRLDVMGGISDYSGSLLLQMPIAETTSVTVQQRNDGQFRLRSVTEDDAVYDFEMPLSELAHKNYAEAGKLILDQKNGTWGVYVLGCILVLHREKNIPLTGMNMLITTRVPRGKGVSSSAAVEVAVMSALCKMHGLVLSDTELPVLAQMAENHVAGASCGLMDQLTVYLGRKNKLLPLICQPHTVMPAVEIPPGMGFCGIDSGIRHAVSGSSYTDVRIAAFMGYSIIAESFGISKEELLGIRDYSSLPFKGYLANITKTEFEEKFDRLLPELISGKDFIKKYGGVIDKVTRIKDDVFYAVKACTAHPVLENYRIRNFLSGLQSAKSIDEKFLMESGKIMLESHAGYTSVGLGNENTDMIVNLVKEYGYGQNVYGARITGGGSGGTVCILYSDEKGFETVKQIHKDYELQTGIKSYLFTGSNDGAKYMNEVE